MTEVEEFFDKAVCLLAIHSPASFHVLSRIQKYVDEKVETMGVCVKSGRIYLAYNPEFFGKLEVAERSYVLIHEMMHVLLHHCTHRSSSDRARAYKENVAMDLAVNSLIPEEQGITIPKYKDDSKGWKKGDVMSLLPSQFGFPPMLSFEEYLALLDEKYPDSKISFIARVVASNMSGKGDESMDEEGNGNLVIDPNCPLGKITHDRISADHDKGFDEDPFFDDMIRSMVETIERNKQWGSMSGGAIENVKKAQEQPINWSDFLRLKLGSFISFEKQPSRRRWNKHYGKPFLGTTTKSLEPVAVYADTSGSVGTDDLSRFVLEIERIAHYATVFFWSFDSEIQNPDEAEIFSRRVIDSISFKGRGGTCFAPIFEHARERQISQVVILTDGCADVVSPNQVEGMDVVWAITPGGNKNGKPGTVIEMRPGGGSL